MASILARHASWRTKMGAIIQGTLMVRCAIYDAVV